MYKSFKDRNSIAFPIFYLSNRDWYRQDGILFAGDGRLLDDTNMPGKTLGIRRLQTQQPINKYPLKKACNSFVGLINSKKNCFIDSNGIPFIYNKTIHCPLKYHKVESIEPIGDKTLIRCKKIPYKFELPRVPYGDARWARVLYLNNAPWDIFDFQTVQGKDSFKRV